MTKKDLLFYIKLYTGCDDLAIKRVEFLLEKYLQDHAPVKREIVREYIDRIIYKDKNEEDSPLPHIEDYLNQFCEKLGVDIKKIRSRDRSREFVRIRRDFSISAHQRGYMVTEIGRALNRDHTSVIHYLYHYKN